MASITVVTGESAGDYYPLTKRTMVIGRDEALPIQIKDELVSRKHVQIRCEESDGADRFILLDMSSANGTFVNGRQITTELTLQDNDIIELGTSKLMFSTTEFPDRESALNHYKARGERGRSTLIQ